MIVYIIAFMFLFCSIGAFLGLVIVSLMENIQSEIAKWIIGIIVAALVSGAITVALIAEKNEDIKQWNNGICPQCGELWEFKGATKYKTYTSYFYSCDKDQIVIELNSLPD